MTEQKTLVRVHMIGNAHIDPVWLWPLREGREEVLASYRTAIGLIREHEGYVFTSGGSATYQWVEEDDPTLFKEIQQAVAQGRWALVNGWWLQPDCNIPGGESFARHALYGQRYLQEHFGQRARVGYNVDSFGHAATLPQLLKLGGLDYYVFFRPGPREKELPQGPFWWEAPGGVRVLTVRPPLHYGTPENVDIVARIADAAADAPEGLPVVMCFYGVGNHGGGPTRRNVQEIVDILNRDHGWRPIFSSPEQYFQDVAQYACDWPVVHDDLQHHSRGCYTVLSRIKRENREAEHALMGAERLSTLAAVLHDAPAATGQLREAWQGVLVNQFHDSLAGTSLRSAYEDIWRTYDQVRQVVDRVQARVLRALSAPLNVPAREGMRPVLVWNPLPWERSEVVRLTLPMGDWRYDFAGLKYPKQVTVEDAAGNALPGQVIDVELEFNTYVVHCDVSVNAPALGARLLYIGLSTQEPLTEEPESAQADTLANEFYRLRIDPETGWIVSLRDLERDVELLAGPANVPLVIDDPSDTWSHNVDSFRDVIGQFKATGPVRLIHDGPARRTLRVASAWGRSRLTQEISLYPGARAIDVTMYVDWHDTHKMLKVAFPLNLHETEVTASAPYGWLKRAGGGSEEPCQGWIDLSGQGPDGPRGLALLNDSKYGYDALDNELRLRTYPRIHKV